MGTPRHRLRPWTPCLAAAALCAAAARAGTAGPGSGGTDVLPDAPAARMEALLRASAETAASAPRAEALAPFREYLALARRRPGAAPHPPAAFFAALARNLLSDPSRPLFARAARCAAFADELCADATTGERAGTAAALVAAAAAVPRGAPGPGIEGLALGWLERAQALDPGDLSATAAWLGFVLADRLPAPDPASFRAAVESVEPPAPVFRYSIPAWEGSVLSSEGNPDAATGALLRARAAWDESNPGRPPPPGWYSALSAARDGAGDAAGAREALERGIAESDRHPTLLNNLAYLLAERGERLDFALDLVDEALAERPLEPAYLDTLGWILYGRGQYEDALDAYHKALSRLKEPDAEIAAHVALAFEALGRREEAAAWWDAVPGRGAKPADAGPEGD